MKKLVVITLIISWFACISAGVLIGAAVTNTAEAKEPVPTAQTTRAATEAELLEPKEHLISLGEFKVTAYCPCEKCCGKWARERAGGVVRGATGIELHAGISCAAPLPMGTRVHIEGIGTYTVQDRTADWVADKYGNRIIDIYFDSHIEAERFGKRIAEVSFDE